MRRLPPIIILRAHVVDKVIFNEYPASPDLGSGDLAVACPFCEGDGVHLQEFSSLFECECLHGSSDAPVPLGRAAEAGHLVVDALAIGHSDGVCARDAGATLSFPTGLR